MSKGETTTIMNFSRLGGFRNFKHFYEYYINVYLTSEFPNTVTYNRFTELMQSAILPISLIQKNRLFGRKYTYLIS
jgi:hypothetical protein